ncbi:MAG: NAD(P)-dependent oxidoreductase [Nitrosomonas sp.]|nr:NAD(P)-dependent oxidoreductase [Nitrosomonas sp.]
MSKLVAVTGATGFIGSVLIQELIHDGWKVRALTRRDSYSDDESLVWIKGDLDNLTALHHLTNDAAFVIHCAATVKGSSFREFEHINIEGTKNLLSVVLNQTQRPRFLYLSSLAARQPELSWYAQSKYLSEQEFYQHSDLLQFTIFRPTAVYGPGDKELKPLFQAMHRGILPVFGSINNRFGLIHVHDLVSAIRAWLNCPVTINQTFELDDGMPNGYSYAELAILAQKVWKRPIHCIQIPDFFMRSIAALNLRLSRVLHYSPMLTPGKVNELQHNNWVCDNAPLEDVLPHWQPKIRLHDILPKVI